MSTGTCQKVQEALEHGDATRRGDAGLDGKLAEHLHSCVSCAEAAGVATQLRRVASEATPRSGLPSASHLWWRAQIIRDLVADETKVERATRSIRWMQGIGLGLLCLLITLGLTGLTANLFSNLQTQIAGGGEPWDWLAGLLLAGSAMPLAGFTALWVIWRET